MESITYKNSFFEWVKVFVGRGLKRKILESFMKFREKNLDGKKDFFRERVRSFFKKYIFAMISVEVVIFVICWVYQLGLFKADRMGAVIRPFPWQSYFLFAFLFPVCMTFFLGLFMEYRERRKKGKSFPEEVFSEGALHRPLFSLFLFFLAASGVVYFLDEILCFFSRMGTIAGKIFLVAGVLVVSGCITICGIRMFFRYRSEKKALQTHYRARVLQHLSMVEEKGPGDFFQGFSEKPSSGAPPAAGRIEKENSGC